MNESNALIILQTISLTVSVCMALMLGLSRFHIRQINRRYETIRWMLFTAMLLLAGHYWAQIHFGFRAQGDDVGALINILFYTPVAYLISFSVTSMASGIRMLKRSATVAGLGMTLIVVVFIIGWYTYKSLHMQHALYTIGAVFFLTMLYFVIYPTSEIRRVRQMIENESGGDLDYYNTYMRSGTTIMFATAVLVPIAVFSKYILGVFGPIFLVALFFYMLSFVVLGFNISSISEIIDSAEEDEGDVERTNINPQTAAMIEERLEKFVNERGYSNPELGLNNLALRLAIDKKLLTQYLQERKGVTFRVWLSDLRIEEVKRMLITHNDYNNESIAQECGFSSRTWMQQRFKAVTGMTPNEWKEKKTGYSSVSR